MAKERKRGFTPEQERAYWQEQRERSLGGRNAAGAASGVERLIFLRYNEGVPAKPGLR